METRPRRPSRSSAAMTRRPAENRGREAVLLQRLRDPRHLGRGHPEARVLHLERLEQALVEEIRQALARGAFDHAAQHVGGEAVVPDRARLERERHARQLLDLLGGREIARVVVLVLAVHADALQALLHRRVLRDLTVREARGVAQEILHRHLPLLRHQRVGRGARSVLARDAHLQLVEARQVLAHRIRELDRAILDQHHRRHRHQRLGHRIDAEDRFRCHLDGGRLHADRVLVDELALPRDHHDCATETAVRGLLLQHLADLRQPLRRHSHLLRLCHRQRLRAEAPGAKNENQPGARSAGTMHRCHGVVPRKWLLREH